MRNNKGFTLVEMLVVLAIIAILSVAIFPNFLSMKESQSEKFSESMEILLKSAAKIYVSNNRNIINEETKDNKKYCMPIGALKAYDYVSIPTYDPVTNKKIDTRRCVYIGKTETNGKIKYTYEVSNDATDKEDYLPPEISLTEKEGIPEGTCKNTMSVTSKEDFVNNCSVIVKDNSGEEITPSVLSEERIGDNYIIKYTAKDSNNNYAKTFVVKLILSNNKSQ